MNKFQPRMPIGVFDSGVGGISLLANMVRELPNERFIYLADAQNAPYGMKDGESVRRFSSAAARMLLIKGIKMIVVACNTATSVAIAQLRTECPVPVIGMEPAVKPAVEKKGAGDIVVMATPLTLKEDKFHALYKRYDQWASIIPLPCPGLMELIESEAPPAEVIDYLQKLFQPLRTRQISSIVLGCTHYCLIKKEIKAAIGVPVEVIDGNWGTTRHVRRTLVELGLTAPQREAPGRLPEVEFMATGAGERTISACHRFLQRLVILDEGEI